MKYLIALDSYKNCISSLAGAEALKKGILSVNLNAEVEIVPLADGGEGSLDALCYANSLVQKRPLELPDALGRNHTAYYGWLASEDLAFVELANICGIELFKDIPLDVKKSSSYGLGVMLRTLVEDGVKKIVVAIGGSASSDCGVGLIQGLGGIFYNHNGEILSDVLGGGDLGAIAKVDFSNVLKLFKDVNLEICCDVTNPLLGSKGAVAVFSEQKGATPEDKQILESGATDYINVLMKQNICNTCDQSGDGAAGGVGFALRAICGGKMCSGAKRFLELTQFSEKLNDTALLITGEGRSDHQTLGGKLPLIVAQEAKKRNIKTLLLSGSVADSELLQEHFDGVFSIAQGPCSLAEALRDCAKNLTIYGRNIASLFNRK